MQQVVAVPDSERVAPSPPARVDSGTRLWIAAVGGALATAYLTFALTLLAIAILPGLGSWNTYVVRSGSMSPSINTGDIVVAAPLPPTATVPAGRVMVFVDPATTTQGDRLLVHRVLMRNDDGTYTTAGDANRQWDQTPVTRSAIIAQARLRVPWVGLPVVWWHRGAYLPFVMWVVLTIVAIEVVRRTRQRRGRNDIQQTGSHRRWRHGSKITVAASVVVSMFVVGDASAMFSGRTTNPGSAWTLTTRILLPYTTNVLADAPWAYFETEEASGSTATDTSGNTRTGTYSGTIIYRQAGALTRVPGHSVRLGSTTSRLVASSGAKISNPTTYSLELWFKTTTTSGGKLAGFESTKDSSSSTYDRYVFMRNDGRLVFGGWIRSGTTMLTSPLAYNDGAWHHLVITARPIAGKTQQSGNMYVDGVRVGTGSTTAVASYSGYWRAGYGAIAAVTGAPSSPTFEGSIDNFAVYLTELSASRVAIHYASR
ncbi:MAG: signal peptidase I [Actinomycetota bacterium]|nr:signal peptidase I [Actinomycetota bacterium]